MDTALILVRRYVTLGERCFAYVMQECSYSQNESNKERTPTPKKTSTSKPGCYRSHLDLDRWGHLAGAQRGLVVVKS
jgi:hypothetical protein